ncbi:MAG: SOS cell division inhibitor SulA [Spongiibacteraceae bacterium]|nr:SOS cell division inhibitor SulA [Spongiibacteraceae bacterium]
MSHLSKLLQNPQLWRSGRRNQAAGHNSIGTGLRRLDQALHSRGWPLAGSTELLCDHFGLGELSLLTPALAQLSQQQAIVWLNPPFEPYAPALQQAGINLEHCLFVHCNGLSDQLWAAEELLRATAFAAVLNWSDNSKLADRDLRRLQLAAREQQCWHIHFRAAATAQHSSPAPLRIGLTSQNKQLQLNVLKQAGGPAGQQLLIARAAHLLHEQKPPEYWPQHTGNSKSRLLLARLPRVKTPLDAGVELH